MVIQRMLNKLFFNSTRAKKCAANTDVIGKTT
jgi:hypothetical protein